LALLYGCCNAQSVSAASSAAIYAARSAGVAVASGRGSTCGRGGTGSMMGLLAASRIGVLVSRSMVENMAAMYTSAPHSSTCRRASLLVASLSSLTLLGPHLFARWVLWTLLWMVRWIYFFNYSVEIQF